MKKKALAIFILFILLGFSSLWAKNNNAPKFNSILFFNQSNLLIANAYSFNSLPFLLLMLQDSDIESLEIDESIFSNIDTTKRYRSTFFKNQDFRRESYKSQLFGYQNKPTGYESKENLDSTGQYIKSSEYIEGQKVSEEYEIELDDYLRYRKTVIQGQVWDSLLTGYDMKKALSKRGLAAMMVDASGLSIPVPPNPIMGIFGAPKISINVNGEVNLRVGWRWDSQNLGTVSAFGQTQSTPIFTQDIRVNVSGGIGDKLKLSTDWNTRRTFDRENQFKVGFEGYDDDIVKLVEFGNVNLPLNTQLIGGGQTLFGVRADFQFGPLFLKTIMSQRRGERRFINVNGGATKQPFQIRAYDFAQNHFFLDNDYKKVYKDYWRSPKPVIPQSANFTRIKQIEVWESSNILTEVDAAEAVAFATLPPQASPLDYDPNLRNEVILPGVVERGRFRRLDTTRYSIDRNLGHLNIYNLKNDRKYAVSYITEGPTNSKDDDLYHGTLSNTVGVKDTLILKLVYVPNLQPGFDTLWSRQMRNIYSIGATNINVEETDINLWYINQNNDSTDVLPNAPDKLVTIFGVDRTNPSGQATPDGKFDMGQQSLFFDPIRGEITFPAVEPFREGLRDYFERLGTPELAEIYTYNDIYDTTYDVAVRNTSRDRFIISGEVSGRSSGRIALGAFNLAPGSVRVTLDGVALKEFTDFVVDYYSGTLTLRNQRAAAPGANLRVEYEQADIFNIATKTLAGIRGDYNLIDSRRANVNLGFTLMHYDQAAIIDRVQLNNEPVSNTMFGLDAKVNWDTPWLTKALDFLPFLDTKAESNINLGAEMALMMPTPNKRKSNITSDNNEPVVFIDDFEGAIRTISLGMNPTQWTHSSQPVDEEIAETEQERALFRGRLSWFKYFIPRVPVREIYPQQQTRVGNSNTAPLEIFYDPRFRGIYNQNPEYIDELNPEFDATNPYYERPDIKPKLWAGMQRLFSSFNTNFDNENIEYVDIMLRMLDRDPDFSTRMYLDIGQISEDIIPNGVLDTEDGITAANPLPNNRIDEGEDVGIDALADELEKESYPFPLNLEEDPARDNYFFDFGKNDAERTVADFSQYNNFENNASLSESGQFPDTEILNPNNGQTIQLANSYFRYEIDLSTTDPKLNPQIVGGNPGAGWIQYRIPLRRPTARVGNPQFSNIQYIRVSYKGGFIYMQVADWKLVGSQWQRMNNFLPNVPDNDTVLQMTFVNRFENQGPPDFYTMPPGVRPPRQLNSPNNEDLELNEQAMALTVNNLRFGEERMAVKIYNSIDLFYYKKLKFFFHGDGSMPDQILPGAPPKAYAMIRFGTDSSNYYEYRKPVVRGWSDVQINLEELTAIKQIRDTTRFREKQYFPVPSDPDASFAIKGNPILTRISFFGLGIQNPNERFPDELTTTVWFNELRLTEPEASSSIAAIANANVKLADVGTIDASFRTQEPNFHMLEQRFGNRKQTHEFNVTMTGKLEKFLPQSFKGVNIPINYSHSELQETPEFIANNDVNLQAAAQIAKDNALAQGADEAEAEQLAESIIRRSQTLRVRDTWGLNGVKLGLPINHWTVQETFNKMVFDYNYTQEFERNPIFQERFNWRWRASAKYSNTIPDILTVKPLTWVEKIPLLKAYKDLKFSFLPSSFGAGVNFDRRRQTEQSRFLNFASPVIRDFTASRTANFSWKFAEGGFLNPIIDYSVNTRSALVKFELDELGRQLSGSELSNRIFFNNGKFMDLGDDIDHTQNVTINFKPILPDFIDINKFFKITGSFQTDYNWNDPLNPEPENRNVSKQASYNNQIRFTGNLSLQSLGNRLFGTEKTISPGRRPEDTSAVSKDLWGNVKDWIKFIFFDFKTVRISFNQTNMSTNPGVYGGTGMTNFWGFQEQDRSFGPSMAYQLGLVSSPHGGFKMRSSPVFPFFGFETFDGLRPTNAIMQDNYSQNTRFDIATNRPLWEGAELDLNWGSNVAYNRNQTVITDASGVPEYTNVIALKSFSRTYISFPTIFGFNLFNNTIDNVVNLYEAREAELEGQGLDEVELNRAKQRALAESFYEGLEAFSITGALGRYLPAVNWGIRWTGMEKWDFWKDYVTKVTFEHRYSAMYDESIQITDQGAAFDNQMVQFGFQPLVGVTWAFDEDKMNGQMTATLRWNSTSNFNLNSANRAIIQKQATNEISAQASYIMKGFEWDFLGLSLQNDLEYSFLLSYKDNSRATFDILDPESLADMAGRELQGNTQITIEPRVRYSLSNRVNASAFVRYESTITAGAANPGFSTTQVGVDIRISIAGGR